jgi:hypothetical protein
VAAAAARAGAPAAHQTPMQQPHAPDLSLLPDFGTQGTAGPPQGSLPPSGGGSAGRPWGQSERTAGPPQGSLPPSGGGPAGRPWGQSERTAGRPQAPRDHAADWERYRS